MQGVSKKAKKDDLKRAIFDAIYQAKYKNCFFTYEDKLNISKMLSTLNKEERIYSNGEIDSFFEKYVKTNNLKPSFAKYKAKNLAKRVKCHFVNRYYSLKKSSSKHKYSSADKKSDAKSKYIIEEIFKNHKNGGCTFYTGIIDQEKVFIKGRDVFKTYLQEKKALNLLNPDNKNTHYLKLYKTILPDTVTLEYSSWKPLSESTKINDPKHFLDFLYSILTDFNKNGIVHRDLMPQNILVSDQKNQEFKVFDFGFAVIKGKNPLEGKKLRFFIEKNLGYPYKPYEFKWDDAYSALLIAEEYIPNLYQKFPKEANKIIKLITVEK